MRRLLALFQSHQHLGSWDGRTLRCRKAQKVRDRREGLPEIGDVEIQGVVLLAEWLRYSFPAPSCSSGSSLSSSSKIAVSASSDSSWSGFSSVSSRPHGI